MKYFQTKLANGAVQIDDAFVNVVESRKIPVNNDKGKIVFQDGEIFGAIGNGTNTIDGYCANYTGYCEYLINNKTPNTFIFVYTLKASNNGNCGVQIFNSTGNIVFNSNDKPAKILAIGTKSGTVTKSNIAIATGAITKIFAMEYRAWTENVDFPKYQQVTVNEFHTETTQECGMHNETDVFGNTHSVWSCVPVTKNVYGPVNKWQWVHDWYVQSYLQSTWVARDFNVCLSEGNIIVKEFNTIKTDKGTRSSLDKVGLNDVSSWGIPPPDPFNRDYFHKSQNAIDTYSYLILEV